jgi:hypothetical protein
MLNDISKNSKYKIHTYYVDIKEKSCQKLQVHLLDIPELFHFGVGCWLWLAKLRPNRRKSIWKDKGNNCICLKFSKTYC